MTVRSSVLVFFIVLVATAIAGGRVLEGRAPADQPGAAAELPEASTRDATARTTISYRLDNTRWTTFTFPPAVKSLRILSHADVAPEGGAGLGDTFRYGLEIEVVGSSGEVLKTIRHFFRTELILYTDSEVGATVTARRYVNDPGIPLAVDRLILHLSDFADATSVRLRVLSLDPGLAALNVRVYRPRPFTRANRSALWDRLADPEKRALSVGYVHAPDLLTQAEQQAILSNRWIPLGPIGIEGQDYSSRKLEIYDPPGVRASVRSLSSAGLLVEPGRSIGIRLPEVAERLQVVASSARILEGSGALDGRTPDIGFLKGQIALPGRREATELTIPLDEDGIGEVAMPHGGTMMLSAEHAAFVRVIAVLPGGGVQDLTAETSRLRYYDLSPGTALSFGVFHIGGKPTPFRLDLRCRCKAADAPSATLTLRDGAGQAVEEHAIDLPTRQSAYDRLVSDPRTPLTEATSQFLSLSPAVRIVEVRSAVPILAAGFVQPVGLPRTYAIPEAYYAAGTPEMDHRTWFQVRAEGTDGTTHAELAVERPVRGAEQDAPVSPDDLAWETFRPEGDWIARNALVPVVRSAVSEDAFGRFYSELAVNDWHAVDVIADRNAVSAEPSLLLTEGDGGTEEIAVLVDGEEVWRGAVIAPARIGLPPLDAGRHDVFVERASGGAVLVSNLGHERDGYLARRLLRIPRGRTTFNVSKLGPGREVLALSVFAPSGLSGRGRLEAQIHVERPDDRLLSDWTVAHRRFDIRFDPGERAGKLLPSGRALGRKRMMFLALGRDIPPGDYQLSITSEIEQDILFLMSRSRLPERRDLILTKQEVREW